jgi:hypothetical protein
MLTNDMYEWLSVGFVGICSLWKTGFVASMVDVRGFFVAFGWVGYPLVWELLISMWSYISLLFS